MRKQIICCTAFLACFSSSLASAQIIAPVANPQIVTKEEVLKRPSVSWAMIERSNTTGNWQANHNVNQIHWSCREDSYIKVQTPNCEAPKFAIHIGSEKFIKGKKLYDMHSQRPLGRAELSQMRFGLHGSDLHKGNGYDEEDKSRLGYAGFFLVDWLMYYDEQQKSFGMLATKLYAPHYVPKAGEKFYHGTMPNQVVIEQGIINYAQPPKTEQGKCVRIGSVEMRQLMRGGYSDMVRFITEKRPHVAESTKFLRGDFDVACNQWREAFYQDAKAGKAVLLAGAEGEYTNKTKILKIAENYQAYKNGIDLIFYANVYWDETLQKIGVYVSRVELGYAVSDAILPAH